MLEVIEPLSRPLAMFNPYVMVAYAAAVQLCVKTQREGRRQHVAAFLLLLFLFSLHACLSEFYIVHRVI